MLKIGGMTSDMTLAGFIGAVYVLLLTPGPTNTLMSIAGASAGMRRVVSLLPAEILGYLLTIVPLTLLGSSLFAAWPQAATAVKFLAGLWIMILALRLWRLPDPESAKGRVTQGQVFITTLLNPKALIFGLVLIPGPPDARFLPYLTVFCSLVISIALLWGFAGRLTQTGAASGQKRLQVFQRAAALWLMFISLSLIARTLTA